MHISFSFYLVFIITNICSTFASFSDVSEVCQIFKNITICQATNDLVIQLQLLLKEKQHKKLFFDHFSKAYQLKFSIDPIQSMQIESNCEFEWQMVSGLDRDQHERPWFDIIMNHMKENAANLVQSTTINIPCLTTMKEVSGMSLGGTETH